MNAHVHTCLFVRFYDKTFIIILLLLISSLFAEILAAGKAGDGIHDVETSRGE